VDGAKVELHALFGIRWTEAPLSRFDHLSPWHPLVYPRLFWVHWQWKRRFQLLNPGLRDISGGIAKVTRCGLLLTKRIVRGGGSTVSMFQFLAENRVHCGHCPLERVLTTMQKHLKVVNKCGTECFVNGAWRDEIGRSDCRK